jgi:hypothetical protein
MVERDLVKAYPEEEHRALFTSLNKEAQKQFQDTVGIFTVFHGILCDRVADAYVGLLSVGTESRAGVKEKILQEKLQKWLGMVFQELHSLEVEMLSRQNFYKQIVETLKLVVPDEELRKKIFSALADVMRKNK